MSLAAQPPRALPAKPSAEHLRKQAKRLAKTAALPLAAAQRRLAEAYGQPSWSALMAEVARRRGADPGLAPLAAAARAGDLAAVEALLAQGAAPDRDHPLWQACAHAGAARLAVVDALLNAGANPRLDGPGETALHAAARRGPLALVERLIRGNALEWQGDRRGRPALAAARQGRGPDRDAIVRLLDRPVIDDPLFRAAVQALQQGDADRLAALLDAHPRLLAERALEPQCYRDAPRPQYFRDPRLVWFLANNPTLRPGLPANVVELAKIMIARGVAASDLDYTLELVISADRAAQPELYAALLRCLLRAGARATPAAIEMALAHRTLEAVQELLTGGQPMTAPIAAALGGPSLPGLLRDATPEEVQAAFGLAVINGQHEAVRLALDAGAAVDAWLPVHRHSTALHQAALDGDLPLLALLVARGARRDIRDRLWQGTALDWARHQKKDRAAAWLAALEA